MATEVATVVDTGLTGDYPSHNAAEADNYGASNPNLVTADEWCNCRCRATNGTLDTTAVDIFGQTTNPTHYIQVWTDPADTGGEGLNGSYRHLSTKPAAGAKIYAMQVSTMGITARSNNIWLKGLTVIMVPPITQAVYCIWLQGESTQEASQNLCISEVTTGANYVTGVYLNPSVSGLQRCWGNVCYGPGKTSPGIGIYAYSSYSTIPIFIYDNTVVDMYYGIFLGVASTTATAKGNLVNNNTDCFFGTFVVGSSNNAWSDGTQTGNITGTDLTGVAPATIFKSPSGDDWHVAVGTPVKGLGIDLRADANCPVPTDIDQETRAAVTEIGADQLTINIIATTPGPAPRPGRLERGRPQRLRAQDLAREELRRRRDIAKAFIGMYRRLKNANYD